MDLGNISKFGELDGADVLEAVLVDGDVSASILNFGCVTRDWRVSGTPMVLGYERFEDYLGDQCFFGQIVGRVANRTAFGRFDLDGVSHQLALGGERHHLHGGEVGLGRRLWQMEADGPRAVRLQYHSPDGEEGYPGAVDFRVDLTLEAGRLCYEMHGVPDRVTPINLAQHSYYSLGAGDVLGLELRLAASRFTVSDGDLIPTGEISSVEGTDFDFRAGAQIGEIGLDLNMVLDEGRLDAPAAVLRGNGRELRLWTDQPGLQVYNAAAMEIAVPGLDGLRYGQFSGLCLEPQHFPDALNRPEFASILSSPDAPYYQRLCVEIR